MKVVILAGGYGTRIREETIVKPKPMIEIGDRPILLQIMNLYSQYGFHDFIICLGYKGNVIKQYFANYALYHSDVTFDFSSKENEIMVHHRQFDPWKVTLVDTGASTMTGGRIKRIEKYIDNSTFMLTYGDGLSDLNVNKLLQFHQSHGKWATLTAVKLPGRFGQLQLTTEGSVTEFEEKPRGDGCWVNGGFFVLEPEIFKYIDGDSTIWEKESLENLTKLSQLMAFKHTGFWHPMDTLRDKEYLEDIWHTGKAPWLAKNEG